MVAVTPDLDAQLGALLGETTTEIDVPRKNRVFCNRNLRMDTIEMIGFDMDYTLALYHQDKLEQLSIDLTLTKLIEKHGYPEDIRNLHYDPRWAIRGVMVDRQLEMLQTALDRGPDAIAFAALDSQAAIPLLERAQEEGIPIVGFDSGVESDIPVTTAATDNVAAAALAADMMAELIGGEGEVAVIAHDQTSRTGIDRVAGFTERMEEAYPDITVVDVQYGAGDHLRSTDLAKAIILAHPELKGFFGANEGSIIGVLNAVTELGMEGELVVIGYDSGQQQLDAIRSGLEAGAITQDPIGIGYYAVEAAVMAIRGEELPEVIDTGFHWFDAETIDDETIAPLLYE